MVRGFNINFDERSTHTDLFSHAAIATAQRNALGGRSKFLAMVCKDGTGVRSYQWSIRSEGHQHYSLFMPRKSTYHSSATAFSPPMPVTEHSDSFSAQKAQPTCW